MARSRDTDPRRARGGAGGRSGPPIEAAGGVVRREREGGSEILVVHRPRYDDWSLPKGKLDDGEAPAAAALREVEEETGITCRLGAEIGTTRYRDSRGRPKQVRYWLMEPQQEDPTAVPNSEVDEIRWVDRATALRLLTYAHDRDLVAGLPRTSRTPGRPGPAD